MKILNPPAISNLDELLDLILHKDKYAKYLKQLQDVRDSILASIGDYNTKERADDYLAQAQAEQVEVQRLMAETQEKAKDNDAQCKERLAQIGRDQDAWTKAKEIEQAALKARQDESDAYFDALAKKETSLNELELVIQQRTAELDKLSAKLTAELEKMEQRKALLNAV